MSTPKELERENKSLRAALKELLTAQGKYESARTTSGPSERDKAFERLIEAEITARSLLKS